MTKRAKPKNERPIIPAVAALAAARKVMVAMWEEIREVVSQGLILVDASEGMRQLWSVTGTAVRKNHLCAICRKKSPKARTEHTDQ